MVDEWLSCGIFLCAVTDVLWWTSLLCFPAYHDGRTVVDVWLSCGVSLCAVIGLLCFPAYRDGRAVVDERLSCGDWPCCSASGVVAELWRSPVCRDRCAVVDELAVFPCVL